MARSLSLRFPLHSPFTVCHSALTLLAFALTAGLSQAEPPGTSALVISGGISLGVYEAGLNHIVVESLRDPALGLPRLASTTGASAGAINTLATALRYCEADNPEVDVLKNSFRDIWIDVGIEELLPGQNSEYEQLKLGGVMPGDKPVVIRDGVLNRSIFEKPIEAIRNKVTRGHFRKDCRVHLGIMVTLGQPKFSELQLGDGSEILTQEQSFAIPLLLESKERADGSFGVVFRNAVNFWETKGINPRRKHILLPQMDASGAIAYDTVMRAALASSAFPLAFGKIELGYCFRSDIRDERGFCPSGYAFTRNEFIDGGYFNNIPLGLAAELLLDAKSRPSGQAGAQNEHYIFMDPDELRGRKRTRPNSAAYGNLDIATQLANILPGISTLRKYDLYDDYHFYFISKQNTFRKYRPTGRAPLLTGNFLAAFGAFLDLNFREYDYAAGLYDGLIYSAQMLCELEGKRHNANCEANRFLTLFNRHLPEQEIPAKTSMLSATKEVDEAKRLTDFRKIIGHFLQEEFGGVQHWRDLASQLYDAQYQSSLRVIHDAIQASGESDFEQFLDALARSSSQFKQQTGQEVAFSERTQYMLKHRQFWKRALAKTALQRLIILEERDDGEHKNMLSAAYIMVSDELSMPKDIGATDFRTEDDLKYMLVPDQIGLDAAQTGVSLGWDLWRVPFTNHDLELGPTLHFQYGDNVNERLNYADIALGIRFSRPSTFWSSWGFAINANQNLSKRTRFGDDTMIGLEFNFGLLADNLRLAAGTRDSFHDYEGEDWTVRLMITNIDELLWAFW